MDNQIPFARLFARKFVTLLRKLAKNRPFRVAYAVFGVLVLFSTTLLWAILGARLQNGNADQLSDPYLFANWHTFTGALFPSAHTFLLKWPIFWLLNVFGVNSTNIVIATVGLVLVTVGTLAAVLYKINRRPLVFGTLTLGLSLALLLVPAQPFDGSLLPANMAMLTTRNIEYAVYLVVLVLFARAKRMRDWQTPMGILLLALLIASDKLFMGLSIGGALLMIVVYAGLRVWNLLAFAVRWLVGSIAAAIIATALLAIISAERITHIVGGSASSSPYGLTSDAHNIVLGFVYSLLGFFTNLGANPAYGNLLVRKLPSDILHGFWSPYGVAYALALLGALAGLYLVFKTTFSTPRKLHHATPATAHLLVLSLVWSTVTAFGLFIVTNHYYAVDARYLTIGLFALATAVAFELRSRSFVRAEHMLLIASVLVIGIVFAVFASVKTSDRQRVSLADLDKNDSTIAHLLKQHKVNTLVGNYWRVLPVKLKMDNQINALPLGDCTHPNGVLDSTAWQPDLHKTKFAYLLTVSGSIGSPNCSIDTIVSAYGRPNATQVIAGTLKNPTEMIFFYDDGAQPEATHKTAAPTTILPITPDQLTDTNCIGNPTVMNIVAHEDDDLLFMNPNLQHDISSGDCIRTVFVTAGNDGQGRSYWIGRQQGSEAAYNAMLGSKAVWVERTVELAKNEYITIANPRSNHRISLVFMNLPDGNVHGEGFAMSGFGSLAKLQAGQISSLRTVDGQSSFTAPQLVRSLAQIMEIYQPAEINTQNDVTGGAHPDHSDHIATSKFTQSAAAVYDQEEFMGAVKTPLMRYAGYTAQDSPANVVGNDLAQKTSAFYVYAMHDPSTCSNAVQCEGTAYERYLPRQYQE